MTETTSIPIRLGERTYEVTIGRGLLEAGAARIVDALGSLPLRALVVADKNAKAHADVLLASLQNAGCAVSVIEIDPTEKTKTLETFGQVLSAGADAGLERSHPIIGVGGGIVGDIAGFAAASYRRGVPSLLCPTTLLSMVDASVGGKTGVNLIDTNDRLLKNMAGAFHQPSLVLVDLGTLGTLPQRHLRSGLAECVKHAMLGADHNDHDAFTWIQQHRQAILDLEPEAIAKLVVRSVRLKATVVETDEREEASIHSGGGRARLNLGHTFAHAMETIGHLSPSGNAHDAPLQHGEAVGLGLIAACETARVSGVCGAEVGAAVGQLLGLLELPTKVAGLPDDQVLLERMSADKKVSRGRLRLVLPTQLGSARLFDDCSPEAIGAGWSAIRG